MAKLKHDKLLEIYLQIRWNFEYVSLVTEQINGKLYTVHTVKNKDAKTKTKDRDRARSWRERKAKEKVVLPESSLSLGSQPLMPNQYSGTRAWTRVSTNTNSSQIIAQSRR